MQNFITIHSPEILHITDEQGTIFYGANQTWYPTFWQQQSGCGPTACANILWYLSKTKPACTGLADYVDNQKQQFLPLMENTWKYVTPGRMGVNRTEIFCEGIKQYGKDFHVPLKCHTLNVPDHKFRRFSIEKVSSFLIEMLEKNLPVAFLNLSNGKLTNLESWHWVTVTGFYPEKKTAVMYDQGIRQKIDIEYWFRTSLLGGGFVAVEPILSER